MPARKVVKHAELLEPERAVDRGHRELRAVELALLELVEDLARLHGDDLGAEALQHLGGEACEAQTQALEVGDAGDLTAEPAARLRPHDAAHHRVHAQPFVELAVQRRAAAVDHPADILLDAGTEWHRGEEVERR